MTILVHSSIQFSELQIKPLRKLEAIAITNMFSNHGIVKVITTYCPNGNCEKELALVNRNS